MFDNCYEFIMNDLFKKIVFFALIGLVSLPCLTSSVDAYGLANRIMSYNGSGISGGLESIGRFTPVNEYVVVSGYAQKETTPNYLPSPPIYNSLYISLRIRKTTLFIVRYEKVSGQVKQVDNGNYVFTFTTDPGSTYDLFFESYNYNYWMTNGDVYSSW